MDVSLGTSLQHSFAVLDSLAWFTFCRDAIGGRHAVGLQTTQSSRAANSYGCTLPPHPITVVGDQSSPSEP